MCLQINMRKITKYNILVIGTLMYGSETGIVREMDAIKYEQIEHET